MARTLPLLLAALFVLPACASGSPASGADGFEARLLSDVPTYSGGMMGGSGPFTLLSLRDGRVVVAPEATGEARADSASAAWDIGLRGTEVIVNGGASGPGGVRGILAEAAFADVTAVPDGLATDGEAECPRGEDRVVCHGSGNGWYTYTDTGVQPIPTRTLVVERPDGAAAKVRFVSYVLGEEDATGARPRFVTLEVVPLPAE